MEAFEAEVIKFGGTAIIRPVVVGCRRSVVVALFGLGLAFGMATDAAAQTCATTDVAITGVTPAPTDPAALAGDCATLLDIMDTLRGTASLNWATTLSMASWDGVILASDRNRVTDLRLISKNLTGSIPDLSPLTGLQNLSLQNNGLTGSIPDLSALTNLEHLLLHKNELTGSIPDLSALANLEFLYLHENELTGSIPDLSALANLQELAAEKNRLTGSIPDLSALANFTDLWLYSNELTGNIVAGHFPASIQRIEINDNELTGSIPDLSALTNLARLLLSDNELTGSIPDLSALTNLQALWLHNNELTETIVAEHFPASLRQLALSGNGLTGSIPNLSALTSLEYLWLHRNELTGSIPATLGDVTSLLSLHLAWNSLTGGIPSELDDLTSLGTLSLCGNDLNDSATLPTALETLRSGGSLSVSSCLQISDAEASEGETLDFEVTHSTWPVRGGDSLTLDYESEDGTATSADYTGGTGNVTVPAIGATETAATVSIQVVTIADSLVEGNETFTVILTIPQGVLPLRRSGTAKATIRDVPPPPPPPPPPNKPPRVSVSCDPCAVTPGGAGILTATASDPDDDPLTYSWSASGGTFDGAADTATVHWTAPATVGAVTIRVTVSDGEGGRASARLTMDVFPVLPEKLSFDISDRSTVSFSTTGGAEPPRVGEGQIRPDGGRSTPSGMALYELRNRDGVLITEEAVPASEPVHRGRIFAEVGGLVRTAVAFANPNGRAADIDFYVTDAGGNRIAKGSFRLEAYGHMAGFLSEEPFNVESVVGTFTFSASPKVAAMAFWEMINAPGECLVAALPVRPTLFPPSPFSGTSTAPVVFPHFAAGDGWSTDVILVNPTGERIAGTVEFLGPDASPGGGEAVGRADGNELRVRHRPQQRAALQALEPVRAAGFGIGAGHAREWRRAPGSAGFDLRRGRQDGRGRWCVRFSLLERVPGPGRSVGVAG